MEKIMEIVLSVFDQIFLRLKTANFWLAFLSVAAFILLYLLLEPLWSTSKRRRLFGPKTETSKDHEEEEKTQDGPTRKDATIFYHDEKTGKKAITLYFTEKSDEPERRGHREVRKKLLIFSFDGIDWFFFKKPKLLMSHSVTEFDNELKKEKGEENKKSVFNWRYQSMKIVHHAQYKTKVKGNYPHLIKTNEAFLFLAEMKEGEALEEAWGKIYLFERTLNPWSEFVIHLWTGDKLEEAISLPPIVKEEIAKIQANYFDQETQKTKEVSLPLST